MMMRAPTAFLVGIVVFFVRLMLVQLPLCTITLGYIDHGTDELTEIAGPIEDRMADGVNVPVPFSG